MRKLLLLDIDGTIMDTKDIFYVSLQATMDALSIDAELDQSLFGMSVDQALSKLNIQSIPKAKKMWEDSFAELCSRHGFYPGIEEMVKSVHENGLLIYILTSRSHCTADPLCNDSAISSYIDGCVAAEDTTHHKPDPEPVRKVLGITGIKPEEAIYIGDTNQDYQAAKAAGVCFGLAGWNKNTVGVNYDYLLERPEDVLQYI